MVVEYNPSKPSLKKYVHGSQFWIPDSLELEVHSRLEFQVFLCGKVFCEGTQVLAGHGINGIFIVSVTSLTTSHVVICSVTLTDSSVLNTSYFGQVKRGRG